MSKAFMAGQFLRYQLRALTRYELHSPFLFAFAEQVLHDRRHYYAFDEIETLRSDLLKDTTELHVEDLGAGSHTGAGRTRRIADIARSSLVTPRFGRLLFRLAQFHQPATILELGTSLGVSTLYLAKGAPTARVITMEGSREIAHTAIKNFEKLQSEHIEVVQGDFGDALNEVAGRLKDPALVFIDGNHRYSPTMEYFHTLKTQAGENSLFVFDDIHWSRGMHNAWNDIKSDHAVTLSMDLFYKGIVSFSKEIHHKTHVVLRY